MIKKFLKALSDFILGKHFERKEENTSKDTGTKVKIYKGAKVYGNAEVSTSLSTKWD